MLSLYVCMLVVMRYEFIANCHLIDNTPIYDHLQAKISESSIGRYLIRDYTSKS